jgi:hypothetical protein
MDQDTLDKLASGEYEISPRSGRLRRKIRVKKKKPFFKRSSVKKGLQTMVWVLLVVAFLVSIVLVVPELDLGSDKKKQAPIQHNK